MDKPKFRYLLDRLDEILERIEVAREESRTYGVSLFTRWVSAPMRHGKIVGGVKMTDREMDKVLDEVFRKVFKDKW